MKLTVKEKDYFDWIDTLPCCHCKLIGSCTHHHPIGVDKMGIMGGKLPNWAVVPLCGGSCHDQVHADGGQGWPQFRWLVETLKTAFEQGKIGYL